MSIGTKPRPKKAAKAKSKIVEAAQPHVVGKRAELEPTESAALSHEEPEARMQSAEAPDAGYGHYTESSDWENRGRS